MRDYFFSLRENKVFTFIPGFETRGFPVHFDKQKGETMSLPSLQKMEGKE